ncbi:OmpH family outer membrane protein [Mucilaginibacter sp. E4BP6]|jgi:outer membrane protein|uniref:OmpH family outer membrane protein n=1 Tax=Mucilaginibacter sp. E4BP6 TaxID=2723089 RepID=UPI0015CB8F46|nr:OmpH family outer membrane protein [Mucilaginibacter sp. E4BP6]NYE65096.1 outer membrane protein [Mucilaginibacter sp. E4BP6]
MKKLLKVALVAVCMVVAGNFAKAQSKIGYINTNQIMEQLPEMKTLQTQMQAYQKTFSDQLATMSTELQSKGQDYEAKRSTMTDASRTATESELQDMQTRITTFRDNAQKQIEAKSNELLKPLTDKLRAAIQAVAATKGYAYVLDSSQIELIVSPAGDDLGPAVKAKLGLQ